MHGHGRRNGVFGKEDFAKGLRPRLGAEKRGLLIPVAGIEEAFLRAFIASCSFSEGMASIVLA